MKSWPNLMCSVNGNRCEIMLLWPNLKCYVDWNVCDRKHSRPIWSNMWNITNDKDDVCPNLRCYVDRNRWYIMLSWTILKCYVDWKRCYRKLSRPIWSNMWIRSDYVGWCHDLVCGALWIGTDSEIIFHDLICGGL
jgi:hypothetical protein